MTMFQQPFLCWQKCLFEVIILLDLSKAKYAHPSNSWHILNHFKLLILLFFFFFNEGPHCADSLWLWILYPFADLCKSTIRLICVESSGFHHSDGWHLFYNLVGGQRQRKYQETERKFGGKKKYQGQFISVRSLSFSNRFIHVRLVLDSEPIVGILGMRREFTMDRTPNRTMRTQSHSL